MFNGVNLSYLKINFCGMIYFFMLFDLLVFRIEEVISGQKLSWKEEEKVIFRGIKNFQIVL